MFVSHQEHQLPVPEGLANPGDRHWRMVEFVLHVPWFLLTVADPPQARGAQLMQTWLVAWERDLASLLAGVDGKRIQGLVCMMPGRGAKSRQWKAREICEVWLVRTGRSEEFVQLIDVAGKVFDGGLHGEPLAKVVERRLLLQITPALPHRRRSKVRED